MKIDQYIEIVRTNKVKFSSLSQKSSDALFIVLSKHYAKVGITIINNLTDLEALAKLKPDLVFLGVSHIPANEQPDTPGQAKISVANFLDQQDIAYTGSGQAAHKLEGDKVLAKQRLAENGLKTAPYCVAKLAEPQIWRNKFYNYPLFIKPTNRGGGAGIDSLSVANNFEELEAKVEAIANEFQADSLIEEYLTGREFSVAILKDEFSFEYLALPIELVAPLDSRGARMLSAQVKSADMEQALAIKDYDDRTNVIELALAAFHALGARDYGRIDIRFDKNGQANFLEANLIPSLISGYGSFPKACLINLGLNYEAMVLRLARLGLARSTNLGNILQPTADMNLTTIEAAFEIDLV